MIDQNNITLDWINSVSRANKNADKILVEKVIRAFLLLEGLVHNGIPFVFKGGTALMLHLNSTKRLSIDIDIILPDVPEDFVTKLDTIAIQQGFRKKEEQVRNTESAISKKHYKFFYTPLHKTNQEEEYILLDILIEDVNYREIIQLPIESTFVPSIGDSLLVNIPSLEDLLGDKLTAFAPNTTGIPYVKHEDSMSMEIIKQLYDIGNLFDVSNNTDVLKATFNSFAVTELAYRTDDDNRLKIQHVLEDIYETALCIVSRGTDGKGNYKELLTGIQRVNPFIFSENYHLEKAIAHASKAAYLSILIKYDAAEIQKFENPLQVKDWLITDPLYNKLNKLKKSNPEAYFYWYKIVEIV
jgi:predicted nucleotidyltransferase component of viral defense system